MEPDKLRKYIWVERHFLFVASELLHFRLHIFLSFRDGTFKYRVEDVEYRAAFVKNLVRNIHVHNMHQKDHCVKFISSGTKKPPAFADGLRTNLAELYSAGGQECPPYTSN